MHFTEVRIQNYKGFADSGPVPLRPGINLLTGKNNAGKTAFLEALALRFLGLPYRGRPDTMPKKMEGVSTVDFKLSISAQEFRAAISPGTRFGLPFPSGREGNEAAIAELLEQLRTSQSIPVEARCQPTGNIHPTPGRSSVLNYNTLRNAMPVQINWAEEQSSITGRITGELGLSLAQALKSRIYAFKAERLNIGLSNFGNTSELEPNARNLPEVLGVLQANTIRFAKYNELLRRVLPQLARISVRPASGPNVEIIVWSDDDDDAALAFPLSESGTGIGQVLAMLYIIATSPWPRIILIDEPNSFLHPGATRALFDVFREYPQHQYIVSTHSPELISATDPSTLLLLTKERGRPSKITQIQSVDTRNMRAMLVEVGARLSDVLGSDRVLWVEGKTEEDCFKIIVQRLLKQPLAGTVIVGVVQTGDFDTDDADKIVAIYNRLSAAHLPLPPPVGFIFDRETRADADLDDLKRRSRGAVDFISRRAYENYLLAPGAISQLLTNEFAAKGIEGNQPSTAEAIANWLAANREMTPFNSGVPKDRIGQDAVVDAPKLLHALFLEFSDNKLEYRKAVHSPMLTEWIVENEPERLREVAELLARKLKQE